MCTKVPGTFLERPVPRVRHDILDEADGPMLKHGLQGMDETKIVLPHNKILLPKPEFLESRFALFKTAG